MTRVPSTVTMNGRRGSFATWKKASPWSSWTCRSYGFNATWISLCVFSVIIEPSVMGTEATPPSGVLYDGADERTDQTIIKIASTTLAAIAHIARGNVRDGLRVVVSESAFGGLNTADNCQSSGDGTTPRGVPAP